ncbi:MAG: hypothetical protein MJA28_08125 [Gammaproteobacteria bacterium]|nr:hypothetical protein [Gammaproteobacteria bacterium]
MNKIKIVTLAFAFLASSQSISGSFNSDPEPINSHLKNMSPDTFNTIINEAYKNKEKWVNSPHEYITKLFDLNFLRSIEYTYKVDNIEKPKNIVISIKRDGFLDDSVRGDLHILHLVLDSANRWEITEIHKGVLCWRGKSDHPLKTCQ